MSWVRLPGGRRYELRGGTGYPPGAPPRERVAYAAAHVVADPLAENVPGAPAVLDWDATLAFRDHLWRYGLGVAEAMDTAQRGMGLDYPATRELIGRSAERARAAGGLIAAGVGTDQLPPGLASLEQIARGYAEQLADVLAAGATPVLMCSRHLAKAARAADDYLSIYSGLIEQSTSPVILHWLGPMFDPELAGYWGAADPGTAGATVLELIKAHPEKVAGIKLSLLDSAYEVSLRAALPSGVRLYTGDDYHYPELIRGDPAGHSHALLGVFDSIAPVAAAALRALDDGDTDRYDALLAPTVPLARQLFAPPTPFYKTGVVFLAWLAGHQEHFTMVGGLQAGRSPAHLARLLVLADEAGLLPDPELAAARARAYFTTSGVSQ
jgi:hypothetical protein